MARIASGLTGPQKHVKGKRVDWHPQGDMFTADFPVP